MEGQGNKKGTMLAMVVVALVIVALVFLSLLRGKNSSGSAYPNATAPQLVATAPSGKIIAGMPQDLMSVVHDATIEKSEEYTVKSPSGTTVTVYTLTFKTAALVKDLYATYEKYATAHGYAPLNGSIGVNEAVYSFKSTKLPDMIFRVTISDNGGTDREVSIIINRQ